MARMVSMLSSRDGGEGEKDGVGVFDSSKLI